jgi:hypothetical protein
MMQKILQTPRLTKRNWMLGLFIGLGLSLNLISTAASAQSYPNRTVKMIVPLTAGSGADIAGLISLRVSLLLQALLVSHFISLSYSSRQ